jgi:hypothetical protein
VAVKIHEDYYDFDNQMTVSTASHVIVELSDGNAYRLTEGDNGGLEIMKVTHDPDSSMVVRPKVSNVVEVR